MDAEAHWTALKAAVKNEDGDRIRELWSPLPEDWWSSKRTAARRRIIETLRDRGHDWGTSPLIEALQADDLETVRKVLGDSDVNFRDCRGDTALKVAIGRNDPAVIKLLLEQGAHITASYGFREPLWEAAMSGRVAATRLLLAAGAPPDTRQRSGRTLLLELCAYGYPTLNCTAATEVIPELIRMLVEAGADVNARDEDDNTPLILEAAHASRGDYKVALALLALGADVNVSGNWGNTALMVAAQHRDPKMLAILMARGAELRVRNDFDWTARMIAEYDDRESRSPIFGADVPRVQQDVARARAFLALRYRNAAPLQKLLDSGLDVHARDYRGWPLLHIAVAADYEEGVELLLERGADPRHKDAGGCSALTLAAMSSESGRFPGLIRLERRLRAVAGEMSERE